MRAIIITLVYITLAVAPCAAADKLTVVKGVLSDVIKEYYEETTWEDIARRGKKLSGKPIRIIGKLYDNPYILDGSTPALFDLGDINKIHPLNCIQIPNVYGKSLQRLKLGSKVEIYGVFFAESVEGPEKDRYSLIRIDAILRK